MDLAPSRRDLLRGTGSLALAFAIGPPATVARAQASDLPGSLSDNPRLDSWLSIGADGRVTLRVGKVELGQGVLTAVAQVCAEELDVDPGRIDIVSGDTALVPNEGTTAGSQSMPHCATAVRHAAAEARAIMVGLAAERLGRSADGLTVDDGRVHGGGAAVTYWELVTGRELAREVTGTVPLKSPDRLRVIGRSLPRRDLPAKVSGGPIYVQDHRPEGMVHGRIVRPPALDATLRSVDVAATEAMPGVLKVVRDGSFVGVIAEREEQAMAAADALAAAAEWDVRPAPVDHDGIHDWLTRQPAREIKVKDAPRSGGQAPTRTLEATYRRPYHMHGSIGPSAAVATMADDGGITIETHSQSVFETGAAIAELLGVERGRVRCRHMDGSGCYGHNGADDVAADAALLARALPGRPVRVQWSRADEHRFEPYGSAMVMRARAGLDDAGDVLDWDYQLWSMPHGTRPGGEAGNLLAARYLARPIAMPTPRNGGPPNYSADRNAIVLYGFPGHRVTTRFVTEMPLRVSSTRGLGAYANVFATESFVDECAAVSGTDPLAYRLRFLDDPRGRDVLTRAADTFGWAPFERRPGRGRGIAFARYKNIAAYTAVAMEVEVDRDSGAIRVVRAVAANDAGQIVSPDGVANQVEGGLIQSLSWSLKEAVRFDRDGVTSAD